MSVTRKTEPTPAGAPDLAEFRRRYPLTVTNFGALGDREAWPRPIWKAGTRVKAPPLWLRRVVDVTLDADALLALAAARVRACEGCALLAGLRFVRAYVEPHRVTVEMADARGRKSFYAARLFVDAQGPASAV